MLLEPGSRVEGPAEEILAAIHTVQVAILLEQMRPPASAYADAELHASRVLDALIRAGFVVRQID